MIETAGVASPDAAQAQAGSQPAQPQSLPTRRPRLDVVTRDRLASRSAHRQATVLRALGVLLVVGALAVTAIAHTLVASDQQQIDGLQAQLTQTLATQQDLQLARASLESPTRVLQIAEHQLKMVSPGSVSYLAPVDPGPSVAQAATAAPRAVSARSYSDRAASSQDPRSSTARSSSSRAAGRSGAISRTG